MCNLSYHSWAQDWKKLSPKDFSHKTRTVKLIEAKLKTWFKGYLLECSPILQKKNYQLKGHPCIHVTIILLKNISLSMNTYHKLQHSLVASEWHVGSTQLPPEAFPKPGKKQKKPLVFSLIPGQRRHSPTQGQTLAALGPAHIRHTTPYLINIPQIQVGIWKLGFELHCLLKD